MRIWSSMSAITIIDDLETHWHTITTTRTAAATLAAWASDPALTAACGSWMGLMGELRDGDSPVANAVVRLAHRGDELAQVTLLVAAIPRLLALVHSRCDPHRPAKTDHIADVISDVVSAAWIEFRRPSLADCTDRVLFRVVSNVDWVVFRRDAARDRVVTIDPWQDRSIITRAGTVDLRGNPPGHQLASSEHLSRLLDVAIGAGFAPGDVELVRRRVLDADASAPAGIPPRTHRYRTSVAIARFTEWARVGAERLNTADPHPVAA